MLDSASLRHRMVENQVARRGVRDQRLLAAMQDVPREAFVDPGFEEFAYDDAPLPIGEAQTISQPYIVALMVEAARIGAGDRVLEVGAGSGYAAAVIARLADRVYAIERHATLGEAARERFQRLGYDNIELRVGDGTRGWRDAAPFDVIVVSAGGPSVPYALKQQLAIGGRLIMPVGRGQTQRLLKVVRESAAAYREEDLGAVSFVPLVGEEGWSENAGSRTEERLRRTDRRPLASLIAEVAEPLPTIDSPAFGAAFDRFARARIVLLGESSHGTSEFYRARAAITRRLVAEHGFGIVAVEADWPDAAAIDRHVRHRAGGTGEPAFQRFPQWMWRNLEVADFVHWLREHNEAENDPRRRAGFFGLDLYNMRSSIAGVLAYLERVDPQAATVARERYGCLTPWQREPSTYGRAVLNATYGKCEEAVIAQCRDLLARSLDYAGGDPDSFLDAAQNARLVASAERYYRAMYYGGAESWNLRDTHMFETLRHLLEAHGPASKAVVWAHNSHIGDARRTDMGRVRDEINIGQLCRENFAGETALIGFGTHGGTVAAASRWDGDVEVKQVRPSRPDSCERLCHDARIPRFLLDFRRDDELKRRLAEPRLERFIGVIYLPESELMSHYVSAELSAQFDAYVWFDRTSAVTPLGPEHHRPGVPETWPFGL